MNASSSFFDALVHYFTELHHLGLFAGTLFAMIPLLPVLMHVSTLRPFEGVTSFSSMGLGFAIDYVQLTDTATLILGALVVLALISLLIQAVRMMLVADRSDSHVLKHLDGQIAALQQDRRPVGHRDRTNSR